MKVSCLTTGRWGFPGGPFFLTAMLKQMLADARETYFEYRGMGMNADDAMYRASSAMLDKLQLRLPWAMTLYLDYQEEFDRYAPHAIPLDSTNSIGTPEAVFLQSLAACLDSMFMDHLNRDEPDEQLTLFAITENSVEVVEWDS